jgi:hypothetical protein
MAYERRLEAEVIGPGTPGKLRLRLGRGQKQFTSEVPAELLQPSLRMPNSQFVAVVRGRDFVRTEPAGRIWLTIQDQIRIVLNSDWDPIGVADIVDGEYDMYIGHIYSLLAMNGGEQAIADHLLWIEVNRMGLAGSPKERLLEVAASLRSLQLPEMHGI